VVLPASAGPAAIVRVAANEYQEAVKNGEPGMTRFCAEQAWVLFGPVAAPVVSRTNQHEAAISVADAGGAESGKAMLISLRGNAELVDRVLQRATWSLVSERAGQ
jgi:hypothetical protein